MKLRIALMSAAAAAAACASTEESPEDVTRPAPQPAAQPEPPRAVGPVPGSIADFERAAGDTRVYFDFDRYALRQDAVDTLRRQAAWLNNYPNTRVLVAGNCDERGTREYNLALGARRANAVKDFLVAQGVDASRVTTISYGKERPIDDRSNDQAWARNRNGHTQIVSGAAVG